MTTALDRIGSTPPAPRPNNVSQATAVEQARAVAEVQAAVTVAQQMPRNVMRAEADMRDSCGRMSLAQRAFYTVPNRGNGPSVHLARELARIWQNIDYGVKELRRDDEAGISEVLAYAWDQEANVRSTRTFVVPHARMKKVNGKQTREQLVDLGDIYLSNQNVGARAVRECIFTVLPTWFTEDAQGACRQTLEKGEGVPLPERIGTMLTRFGELGVRQPQLEQKVGKKRGAWTAGTVAELAIAYQSITRDGLAIGEVFETDRVSAAEIRGSGSRPATVAAEQPTQEPAPTAGDDVGSMTEDELWVAIAVAASSRGEDFDADADFERWSGGTQTGSASLDELRRYLLQLRTPAPGRAEQP
jgi:hypothetical protein